MKPLISHYHYNGMIPRRVASWFIHHWNLEDGQRRVVLGCLCW